MSFVEVRSVSWHLSEEAHADLAGDRKAWGEVEYSDGAQAFKEYLCAFFSGTNGCAEKFGTIAPMGATDDGGKILKMRWLRPGMGKSGGYRFALVVYCDLRKVVLCRALLRGDEPAREDVEAASKLASR